MAFHLRDGFFASRQDDGSVKLEQRISSRDGSPVVFSIEIDTDGWASVVASVSKQGEESGRFYQAKEFHMGAKADDYAQGA